MLGQQLRQRRVARQPTQPQSQRVVDRLPRLPGCSVHHAGLPSRSHRRPGAVLCVVRVGPGQDLLQAKIGAPFPDPRRRTARHLASAGPRSGSTLMLGLSAIVRLSPSPRRPHHPSPPGISSLDKHDKGTPPLAGHSQTPLRSGLIDRAITYSEVGTRVCNRRAVIGFFKPLDPLQSERPSRPAFPDRSSARGKGGNCLGRVRRESEGEATLRIG